MIWTPVLNNNISLEVMTKALPPKGNLVYEYNPFRNYRLSKSMYEYKNSIYSEEELFNSFGIFIANYLYKEKYYNSLSDILKEYKELTDKELQLISPLDKQKWSIYNELLTSDLEQPILREKGELVDFITDELKFSLENPVYIIPQYSYDGSVNLIINDGINIPRLINSRFSATGKNTYEIIDRKGNNDTNIYDLGELFDIDTSLYKRITKIPKIEFKGVSFGGNLKVGNYHFYFKLADADGNETDFVGETGLISIFIGFNDPSSIHSGTKNENAFKLVEFLLTNLDNSYDNIFVYYSRYTAEGGENFVTEYKKIDKPFPINSFGIGNIIVTGHEDSFDISATDINLSYNVIDSSATGAVCLNRLFLANVHKPDIPYQELSDLSLRFLPYLKEELYPLLMDLEYQILSNALGYYDPKYIHDKTGYWPNEIYRFGIVYILPNNEFTPVFNIRGACNIKSFLGTDETDKSYDGLFTNIPVYDEEGERIYINYNEETFAVLADSKKNITTSSIPLENIKGVCKFEGESDKNTIYGLDVRVSKEVIDELKKYVKGYFFVRQTRIPTILAQGITVGIDKVSRTPCLPTVGGIIDEIDQSNLDHTYLETKNLDGVNFISEGFLNRYSFSLKPKGGFLKLLSGIIQAFAAVFSFVPGIGSLASIVINAAAFVLTSVIEGKFLTAAFLSTIATAAVPGLQAVTKGLELVQKGEKVAKIIKTISKITNATKIATQSLKYAKAAAVGFAIINGIEGSYKTTTSSISLILQMTNARKYNGRNTVIPKGYKKVENDDSRKLSNDFAKRVIIKSPERVDVTAIICPDYSVNLAYYNLIFTGGNHIVKYTKCLGINYKNLNSYLSNYFTSDYRHFYHPDYFDSDLVKSISTKIIAVPDNVKAVGLQEEVFRSRAGEAEEAWRYEQVGKEYNNSSEKLENADIVRGVYSPYLAISNKELDVATIVDIMIPEYSDANINNYFYIRMIDHSQFFAISSRYEIGDQKEQWIAYTDNTLVLEEEKGYKYELYRGDCYLCLYTQRIHRNFNDPSAPYNDTIVDENTWKNNYNPDKTEKYEQINLGDVNAVPLGTWVTFRLRSSNNLNIRTLDGSNVDESTMVGHPRGYYPYHPMSTEGTYKHPESEIYNKGFTKSVSERWNIELPDVPHIKNWFGTRIMYSDIHINDAYKNGFRVFLGTNYRDYTREYGEIVKLVSFESSLLCVFEHGIALIPVNERAIAGQGAGGMVYVNTSNVLPENPKIISDMFGSQWPESVLKVPGRTGDAPLYVYGVDTIAKKIWRTDGNTLECISDFKVQEFLNNNITLGERELTPKIGIRNVKTHYNAYKRDVMFTFYDNTYGFEEKVWNLCWNELLLKFITFYSWVPSYMENINNIPFSFNRDTSKWIAKLGTSHTGSSFADGITLSNIIINNNSGVDKHYAYIDYINKLGETKLYLIDNIPSEIDGKKFIAILSLSNRVLPNSQVFYDIKYSLQRDNYRNSEMFDIIKYDKIQLPEDAMFSGREFSVYALVFNKEYSVDNLFSELYYRNYLGHTYADYEAVTDEGDNIILVKRNYVIENKLNREALELPIFKDITGRRPMLSRELMLNPDKLVTLLNIKAQILIQDFDESVKLSDDYYNMKAGFASGTTLVDAGYYESVVAITPKWNLLFLSTDFWKHGQAGLIDIADDIYPTYWYGKQHPFEFEVIVVNDPSTHKIFSNLELVANKALPESFHYEIIGESYDFAKDKVNMYFRLEAKKAVWQYNGSDITYNRDFLKIQPRQLPKSADLPHKYYYRLDTINEIEDYYNTITLPKDSKYNYKHLSGAEIVYYPNRQEYRIWQHTPAVNIDNDLSIVTDKDSGCRGLLSGNMTYLEDKWKVTINPILICYKNEGKSWKKESSWTSPNRPPLTMMNSPIPDDAISTITNNNYELILPEELLNIGYTEEDIDYSNWLDSIDIYGTSFGEAQNRKELDLKDRFMKVRIRYSGEELAVIDFLNTVYRISYS